MAMTGDEIRKSFIRFFESKGHKHVRSSSLVPINDPTILFTNAGMNQFKDYFLGNQVPEFKTAVTSQKVMRAGGKHNDLDNVGKTDRHHTFFEMLGNFSFGDYFKKEAIGYAWDYLTVELKLPKEKLVVSVYVEDNESFDIWNKDIGIPAERIGKLGEKENFWSMGDTGPCGPCSEIHYELTPIPEGSTVQKSLEDDDGTFLEIWNLVFMQYNRESDGTMIPLPKPSIDTGMGLERIASVIQRQTSNYGTDLLNGLVSEIKQNAPDRNISADDAEIASRVIADHIRAVVFLIADGVVPSNEGRGYVLRRIIRRAARYGKEIGYMPGFFSDLVDTFIPMMSDTYTELVEAKEYTKILLSQEEHRFSATLNQGMKILNELIQQLDARGLKEASGEEIFKLYDTYGFPADLAQDILFDNGIVFDQDGFDQAMKEQKERAKAAHDNKNVDLKVSQVYLELIQAGKGSRFIGYTQYEITTRLIAVIKDQKLVTSVNNTDEVEIALLETPFYAESGGQVGDKGEIIHNDFRVQVSNTKSPVPGLTVCIGKVISSSESPVDISSEPNVTAKVNINQRVATERNHTATHLLQAGLRHILGEHVKQAGSLVSEEKLRFDFSHYAPLTPAQLADVEAFINEQIRLNEDVTSENMSFDDASQTGAMAIFGEKYGDEVRVITAGSSSKELCGGCHTSRSGNIGVFIIISEDSIASGIRRIEALTGDKAFEYIQKRLSAMDGISRLLKTPSTEVEDRVRQMATQAKEKEKVIDALKKEIQAVEAEKALKEIKQIGGINLLIQTVDESINLKSHAITLQKMVGTGIIVLANLSGSDKISLTLSVSKDLTQTLNAGNIIKELSPIIEGRGGGSPNLAQCGGTNPGGWEDFCQKLENLIKDTQS